MERGTPESMPDVTTSAAEPSVTAPEASETAGAWHGVAPRTPRRPSPKPARRRPPRPRWLSWLRVIALVILLPLAAFAIGLLIAWIVHQSRGNPTAAQPPAGPQPSISAASTPAPTPSATPKPAVVPADWIAESDPPAGVTFRHPPGWIRRTALPEILRFAPASAGSTTPGIEGVGAGIEATEQPSQALQRFVARAYGGEPQLQGGPITSVSGAHPGEQQQVVTYVRGGVPVRVVVHAFAATGSSSGHSVIVLARAASAQPSRAAELEAAVEASLQLTG